MSTKAAIISRHKCLPYDYVAEISLSTDNGGTEWTAATVAAAIADVAPGETFAPTSIAETPTGEIWMLGADGAWAKWDSSASPII